VRFSRDIFFVLLKVYLVLYVRLAALCVKCSCCSICGKLGLFECRILDKLPSAVSQCQVRSSLPVDMIYTDIVGLIQFKRKVRSGYAKFRYWQWLAICGNLLMRNERHLSSKGYCFSGISGNLKMSGNWLRSGKRPKVRERSVSLCGQGNLTASSTK